MKYAFSDITPEFDYNLLLSKLKDYKNPRSKISTLIASGEIIRVKKGLYVLGPEFNRPFSLPVLANIIYGPSYISLNYALALYGLIPERVHVVTSICAKRNKNFITPVGEFDYSFQSTSKCFIGLQMQRVDNQRSFIIATKEKALVDILYRQKTFSSVDQLEEYIIDSLRIESDDLKLLRLGIIKQLVAVFGTSNISLLLKLIRKLKNE